MQIIDPAAFMARTYIKAFVLQIYYLKMIFFHAFGSSGNVGTDSVCTCSEMYTQVTGVIISITYTSTIWQIVYFLNYVEEKHPQYGSNLPHFSS